MPSWPAFGSSLAVLSVRGGLPPTGASFHPPHPVDGKVGHVQVEHRRLGRRVGNDRTDRHGGDLGGTVPALVGECLVTALALTPQPVTAWLTATPVRPPLRAVRAAPMVPEW